MYHGQVEGTDIVVVDKRFEACFAGHVRVERLWTGCRWAEGPAWFAAGRYLVWSDIPNNRIMRFVEPIGRSLRVPRAFQQFQRQHRRQSGPAADLRASGAPGDAHRMGRRHQTHRHALAGQTPQFPQRRRREVRRQHLVHRSAYGIDADYEGDRQPQEIEGCHVYRVDPRSGEVVRGSTNGQAERTRVFARRVAALRRRHWRHPRCKRPPSYPPIPGRFRRQVIVRR